MLLPEKLFGNIFDDRLIIPSRLYNFGKDTLNNFTVNNSSGDYTALTIRNPDDNASIFVWLAATPNETMPSTAIEVEPGKAHQLKPSQLGPLTNPFLLIHNSSSVNEGAWEVEVVG